MRLSEFDFDLPEELIATRPAKPRSSSRLLVVTPDRMTDATCIELPDFLESGDRLILNDTKVIPARLSGVRRRQGADGDPARGHERRPGRPTEGHGLAGRSLPRPERAARGRLEEEKS